MEYELRIYKPKAGEFEAFVAEWQGQVVPLRRAAGFEFVGAWRTEDDRFVWILGYDGDFAAADEAYYESEPRRAVDPDPARHLDQREHVRARRVF
jgi:hypothetical protein